MVFFGDPSNKSLSEKLAKELDLKLSYPEIHTFPDGEKRVRVLENVVDQKSIVLKSLGVPVHDNLFELALIIDAIKRTGGSEITATVPYIAYQRGDHVFRVGEGVGLEVVIKVIEGSGVDRVLFVDPHSIKLSEMFKIPAMELSALSLFAEKIKEIEPNTKKITLVTPDMGGIRRIKILSGMLNGANYVSITKERDLHTGEIKISSSEGEFKGICFVVDDMISTGGTIVQAADFLFEKGIRDIYLMATHPVFVGNAIKKLKNSKAEKIFVTDSIPIPKEKRFEKLETLTIAEEIAKCLKI